MEPGQEIEYKVNFKYQDIKKMKISEATAEEVKNATESEFEITEEMKQGVLIGTLLILLLKITTQTLEKISKKSVTI